MWNKTVLSFTKYGLGAKKKKKEALRKEKEKIYMFWLIKTPNY